MKLETAAAMKSPGTVMAFRGVYPAEDMEFGGRAVRFSTPLTVSGTYVFDNGGFTVKGRLETLLRSNCARCTKDFDEPFSFDFEERFEKTADEDEGVYAYREEELDLTAMIRDNIFLNLPLVSVCRADCKGLCSVCGCDRNITRCGCVIEEPEQTNRPLSALCALLNENKEV